MIKIKFLVLFVLLFLGSSLALNASSDGVFLKDSLRSAEAGNYVVILQNKNFSLLHIFQTQENSLIIEEISAPIKLKSKLGGDWQKWLDDHAPGHISWIMYELDLETAK